MDNPAAAIRVTNKNNTWNISDKYGGVEYKIGAGETITMPREATEHIFGYGLDEKERFKKFMRMGIANVPKGREMWDKVVCKAVTIEPTGVTREAA